MEIGDLVVESINVLVQLTGPTRIPSHFRERRKAGSSYGLALEEEALSLGRAIRVFKGK